jgi:hypothetical protein
VLCLAGTALADSMSVKFIGSMLAYQRRTIIALEIRMEKYDSKGVNEYR